MNFDFLKGLNGLDTVYKPCTDAEELVKTKPYLSLIAARKSAELLAKFVYMAAHASAIENQTFADILSDVQVRRFINDRHVMDAFHYIRKNGNTAVHGDQDSNPEMALSVLQNLHFVAGETAKDLDLIDSYPDFDENIAENPDATFNDDMQITEKVMQMFIEYIEQHERDKNGRLVTLDLRNPAHWAYALHGMVVMHEHIEFEHQPYYQSTLEYLQRYVRFISDMACESSDLCVPGTCKIDITIDGDSAYTGDDEENLNDVLYTRLPQAKSFAIDCYVNANLRSFYDNPDPDAMTSAFDEEALWQGRGMADQLEAMKRREKFVYKAVFRYPDDDNHTEFALIRNGKSYDVEDICKPDFLQKVKDCTFFCNCISMYADFDFQAHPEIVQQLREAVRAYLQENELELDEDLCDEKDEEDDFRSLLSDCCIPDDDFSTSQEDADRISRLLASISDSPKSQIEYLEDLWEENDEEGFFGDLLSSSCIPDGDLSTAQQFADRINQILAPIADQCTIYMNYPVWSNREAPDPAMPSLSHCFYDQEKFAVASFVWEDHKLRLVRAIL